MSQRREQDKAIFAASVCVSGAFSVCVHQCGQLCVYVYVYCIHVSVHVPLGTTWSALLLVGPGSVELPWLHLCWTTICVLSITRF